MPKSGPSSLMRAASSADLALGNPEGAIGWHDVRAGVHARGEPRAGRGLRTSAPPLNRLWPPSGAAADDSYLVDSASSHMLVSKIKPCMSKYKQLYGETANGSLNQLSFI